MRRLLKIMLAIGALVSGGCGTFANTVWLADFEGGKRPYGGVLAEAGIVYDAATRKIGLDDPGNRVSILVASGLDLPLTAIGDTLTLPYTIPYSMWWADRTISAAKYER